MKPNFSTVVLPAPSGVYVYAEHWQLETAEQVTAALRDAAKAVPCSSRRTRQCGPVVVKVDSRITVRMGSGSEIYGTAEWALEFAGELERATPTRSLVPVS